jgi:ketosteroid isomerase-like protein
MSQENVEIVRRAYEYLRTTRDFRPETFHDDFVWDMSKFRGWPERQTYHGVEGTREFAAAWLDAWEDWELAVEELHETGDKVVAILRQRGRSKTGGLP